MNLSEALYNYAVFENDSQKKKDLLERSCKAAKNAH